MNQLKFLIVGIVSVALAGGGWLLWTCQTQQRQTTQQLLDTQAALAKHEQTLTLIEEERKKLSSAYDTLKDRWTASEGELKRFTETSERLTRDLQQLSTERSTLQHQLDESKTQQTALRGQVDTLQRTVSVKDADRALLEMEFEQAKSQGLTPAEVEQLGQAITRQHTANQQLSDQLTELSRTYEQAVEAQISRLSLAAPTAHESHTTSVTSRPFDSRHGLWPWARSGFRPTGAEEGATGSARGAPRTQDESQQLAMLYRQLGDLYEGMFQYPKAAQALERSLTFKDDANVHERLVWIYTWMLHDPVQAQRHAKSLSSSKNVAIARSLDRANEAQGLPRSSWHLVWQWLTQQ